MLVGILNSIWGKGKLGDPAQAEGDEFIIGYICIASALVLLAGLMSGLTLGLLSLDQIDLEVSTEL